MWKIILFRIIHAQNQITKLFIDTCPLSVNVYKNITLVNCCQWCIDYKLNKHMLKIFLKNKKNRSTLHTNCNWKLLISYSIPSSRQTCIRLETQTNSECTRPTVLYLSFQFHNNNSITINTSENWITLTTSYLVTWYFRPNSDHSNKRAYRKPIDKRLKRLPNERSGVFLWLTTPELWKIF